MTADGDLSAEQYRDLAEFRRQIRQFLHFSEATAKEHGVEPQQHQLLLAVQGLSEGVKPTIREIASRLYATVKILQGLHFGGPFVVADGRIWHDGGASEAQELAFVMATGVAYLRALENLDDSGLARAVSLALSADQDSFPACVKFASFCSAALASAFIRVMAVSTSRRDSLAKGGDLDGKSRSRIGQGRSRTS